MFDPITNNIIETNRCNQRGGRMLSIVDLIERKSVDLKTAAYLAYRVYNGASFIVGAVPGGAGKTTVMGALLNLLAPDVRIVPAENRAVINTLVKQEEKVCALAHEISHGMYYCYLWGEDLRAFFTLSSFGHILATNLHADNLCQVKEQICRTNRVPIEHLNTIDLFIFLTISGGMFSKNIKIAEVLSFNNKTNKHETVFPGTTCDTDVKFPNKWETFLSELVSKKVYSIEDVRHELVSVEN